MRWSIGICERVCWLRRFRVAVKEGVDFLQKNCVRALVCACVGECGWEWACLMGRERQRVLFFKTRGSSHSDSLSAFGVMYSPRCWLVFRARGSITKFLPLLNDTDGKSEPTFWGSISGRDFFLSCKNLNDSIPSIQFLYFEFFRQVSGFKLELVSLSKGYIEIILELPKMLLLHLSRWRQA